MMNKLNKLMKPVDKVLNNFLKNETINIALKVFLVLYAGLFAPKLPHQLLQILNHPISKIIVAMLIILLATRDVMLAILVSVCFIITLNLQVKENFDNHTEMPEIPIQSESVDTPSESSPSRNMKNRIVKLEKEVKKLKQTQKKMNKKFKAIQIKQISLEKQKELQKEVKEIKEEFIN